MPEIRFTEEDQRRIDAAVAAHDPTGWLSTTRIRLFSEEGAAWYADMMRPGLRGAVIGVLIAEALREAITELGGTIDTHDMAELESQIREMFEKETRISRPEKERWARLSRGIEDEATDEDQSRHFDGARDAVRKEMV